ncbi:MAG: sensor domain-containing diguanylate cyclase [Acidimicrobiales bacterium]
MEDRAGGTASSIGPSADGEASSRLDAEGLAHLLDVAPQVTLLFDADLQIVYMSAGGQVVFDWPPDQIVGTSIADHILVEDLEEVAEAIAFVHETGTYGRPLEFRVRRPDGTVRSVEGIARNLLADPAVRGYVAVLRDITDRHLIDAVLAGVMANADVADTLALIAELGVEQLDAVEVAIAYDLDGARRVETVHRGQETGLWPARIDEAPWSLVVDGEDRPAVQPLRGLPVRLAADALEADVQGWVVVPVDHPGTKERLALLGVWLPAPSPLSPARYQALRRLADLAAFALERWRYDQLLLHAARHDQLTELPNREQFFGRLRSVLGRTPGQPVASVLYVDLDGFKPVNDTYGHGVGDRLLEVVARRLQQSVRGADLVARLGGDEFAVVCPGLVSLDEAGDLADRLIATVAEPVLIDGERIAVGASAGVALGRGHEDPDMVLNRADQALYEAKRAGRGGWCAADDRD